MAIPPAPSAPPTSVRVSEVTSSSITVQWGPVDCIHRNGDITGYSVRFRKTMAGPMQDINVSGVTEYTITGLMPSTTYIVRVGAVNSAGRKFSDSVNTMTEGIHRNVSYQIVITHTLQLQLQSCQLVSVQPPSSPSPGLVMAQRLSAMR